MAHIDTAHWSKTILFFLNGKKIVVDDSKAADTTLLSFLRSRGIGLTGSKLGCGEGGCGACTVMVSRYNSTSKTVDHRAVNACLALLPSLDGSHVVTIEGLGTIKTPHVVQRRIAEYHGSQCGFCTPGIVMALYAYLRNHPMATKADIEDSFDGNLCRCTGYRPILDAAKTFGSDYVSNKNGTLCPSTGLPCSCARKEDEIDGGLKIDFPDSPADPIFPPFLKTYKPKPLCLKYKPKALARDGEDGTKVQNTAEANACEWYRPVTLEQLLRLKHQHPEARISVGTTEITIEMNLKRTKYPYAHFISPMAISELADDFRVAEDGVIIGSAVSLSKVAEHLKTVIKSHPAWQTRSLQALVEQLKWFAGTQIRNVACIGGNLATASPISDINPVLVACGAIAHVQWIDEHGGLKEKDVKIDRHFFTGYRRTSLMPQVVIVNVKIPFTQKNEFIQAFKQSRRKDDDIAIASAAFRLNLQESSTGIYTIQSSTLVYGGMAPFTKSASKEIEHFLQGKDMNSIDGVFDLLRQEFTLDPHAPGGMIEFRCSLVLSFFYKYMLYVQNQLQLQVEQSLLSSFAPYHREVSHGTQVYENARVVDLGVVGEPQMHTSALKQVTGEAKYVDDISVENVLYAAFVFSEEAHAKVLNVDPSKALAHEGVVAYYGAEDIPGTNDVGYVLPDEELFASKEVLCVGYPIGIVVAKSLKLAQQGAKLVQVEYEKLETILTIEEAIKAQAFYPVRNELSCGTLTDDVWARCDHVEMGTFSVGGQEHFYLEPHTSLAIPGEEDEMTVWAATQGPTKIQNKVAAMLRITENKVVVKTKRIGGGFGGKETKNTFVSCAAALAAYKLHSPVRITLDRDEDMGISGTRHPFYCTYKVGFSKEGKLHALHVEMYSNGGCVHDLSIPVGERALMSLLSAYQCPNFYARATACKTNWPSPTAFRGFGAPQATLIMETIMTRVISVVKREPNAVRSLNFSKTGDLTHFGQRLDDCHVGAVWDMLLAKCDYDVRLKEVEAFNASNRYVKRGILCVPTQFGLGFSIKMMNQAGALINLYTDGTALVATGGVEMGQGLNTKLAQLVSAELDIPLSSIHLADTATDRIPNTMPTAGSVSTDLNGMAALDACKKLKERLAPYKTGSRTFAQACLAAHMDRVSLSATGFFLGPLEGWDWETHKGTPCQYFSWGAACSEVEIDCLTGSHTLRRVDLVMDVGQSINPAVDIGQIEGAFTQGYGLCTMEELIMEDRHSRTPGRVFTRGPSTYKIPAFKDVPLQFNVHLLPNSHNLNNIHSSKGVGEPPLLLGTTVFFALKQAIAAARIHEGQQGDFDIDSPATCERIRMSCPDRFTTKTSSH